MTEKLLVLMDLGRFKAYRVQESAHFSNPRLELIEEWETQANDRISDQVTDQAGQFSKGSLSFAAVSDMSNGEQHNLDLEQRRRAIKALATRVTQLLDKNHFDACYFAAGKEINSAVLDSMSDRARGKIQRNVSANLTRLNTSDVMSHIYPAA